MWELMKETAAAAPEMTTTENGARTYRSSGSYCLDLFATAGALRRASDGEIVRRFARALGEDPDTAMKLLFFARDVRGGLGERRFFRVVMRWLADRAAESVRKNLAYAAEFGRWDDVISLLGTRCEADVIRLIREQLDDDLVAYDREDELSLLAKWLPSINASDPRTVRAGKRIARALGLSAADYRRTLTKLRARIRIIENSLRERDYTFDYSKQPSRAMFKYRRAFMRNDGERYRAFIESVSRGGAVLHTGALTPYDIISPIVRRGEIDTEERAAIDASWRSLEDFTGGEDALVVVDGSGSMYGGWGDGAPLPAAVAMSLGIYFAERNKGAYRGRFITFSRTPRLVEIRGADIYEKVRFCMGYSEAENTDIQKVFELVLDTAVRSGLAQEDLPSALYFITDMEFDQCADGADVTNFERSRSMYEGHGYQLPRVIFWNVDSRNEQQPVRKNDQGAALVSGSSPRIFSMLTSGTLEPYAYMMHVLGSERYSKIAA